MTLINESQKPWRRIPTQKEWDDIWKNQADGYCGETESPPQASNTAVGNPKPETK